MCMTNAANIDEDRLYRYIGERIKRRRIEAGLTQAQLAERSSVLRTSIASIETARQKAPLHVLYRLCVGLEIDTRTILPPNSQLTDQQFVGVDVGGVIRNVPPKAAKVLERLLKE